jgi:polysaccharide biosynthesis protein PslG
MLDRPGRGCYLGLVGSLPLLRSRWRSHFCLLWVALALAATGPLLHAQTGPDVADGLGIGIHFVRPQPGEIQSLRETGVRWVRKDLDWASTETTPGVYDFSAYDPLIAQFESAGLHTLFILCYYNPHYDHGLSPASEEARQAFARWAVAAVTHFRGHHILWEIYNEPNFRFWTPRPNTEDYIKLALAVSEAVQESAADEKLVGPASAQVDLPFLEACFKAGLLNYWSAISIHTYTMGDPETVAHDLLRVKLLMRKYAPPGKIIPVIITEWGYSAVWKGMDERRQAEMLARGWLTQIASDELLSFWYDWEGGGDPHDAEQHFGLIGPPAATGGSVSIPLKPAYQAVKTLTRMIGGFHFNKRLTLEDPKDYVLLFSNGKDVRLAVWTMAAPHQATLPASAGSFQVTGVTGEDLSAAIADRHGLELTLTNAPVYLVPDQPNDLLAGRYRTADAGLPNVACSNQESTVEHSSLPAGRSEFAHPGWTGRAGAARSDGFTDRAPASLYAFPRSGTGRRRTRSARARTFGSKHDPGR